MNLNERVMAIAANLLNEDMSNDILDKVPLDDKYWLDKTYSKEDIYSLFCDLLENEGTKQNVPINVCRGLMSKWISLFDFSVGGKYRVDAYEVDECTADHHYMRIQACDDNKNSAIFSIAPDTPEENAKVIVRVLGRLVRDGIEKFNADNIKKASESQIQNTTKITSNELAEQFYEEFKKQLPDGHEAIYNPNISEDTPWNGLTRDIPNIDIYNRNYKPSGQIELICAKNPLFMYFENKDSGDWCKDLGDNIMLVFSIPGTRGFPTREIWKPTASIDKTVKNIIKKYIKR
jgi:hypothetical protein